MRKISIIFLAVLLFPIDCSSQQYEEWLSLDGGLWPHNASVETIVLNSLDSQIYVGGLFRFNGDGEALPGITRWISDVEEWDSTSFGGEHTGSAKSFNFFGDRLIKSGPLIEDNQVIGAGIVEWIPTEQRWEYLSDGPNDIAISTKLIDNKFYALGGFHEVGGTPSYGIGILEGDEFSSINVETNDPFGPDINDAEKFQGEIYISGKTMTGAPYYDWRSLARLEGESLEVVHEEFTGTFGLMWVYGLEVYQDQLLVCGNFNEGLGFTGNGIQAFDGEDMHALGGGVNWTVYDMKVYKGELYVVGDFFRIGDGISWQSLAGEPCGGVAKWNGETWTCLSETGPSLGSFRTLEIYDDTLYVGGNFRYLEGDSALTLIARKRIYPDTTIVGVSEIEKRDFSIYPNPTRDQFTIGLGEQPIEKYTFSLYNSLGEMIRQKRYSEQSGNPVIDVSILSKGIYLVQLEFGDGILTRKVVVE